MEDVKNHLDRIGMSEYTTRFLTEGFDTWEVIMDITEGDLASLGVSMAHQKRLRQEILDAWSRLSRRCSPSRNAKTRCKYISLCPISL